MSHNLTTMVQVKKKMQVEMERAEKRSTPYLMLIPMMETMLNVIPTMIDYHLFVTMKKTMVEGIEVNKINDAPATW